MRLYISKFFHWLSYRMSLIAKKIYVPPPTKFDIELQRWFKEEGDKQHRLNYNLNENSIVFDLGGYEGQWASDIYSKYRCTVYVFEPFEKYAEKIKERFLLNSHIKVFPVGLAEKNKSEKLSLLADGSSMFRESTDFVNIKLVETKEFIQQNNIGKIDLIKINIEGGEYDLLDHLIETGLVKNINNIQVQFHDIFPGASVRMNKIRNELSETHLLTYQYEFVWENWKLKKLID